MKTVTGFFMAWGNFCAIPCPCKKWDEKARTHMLVMFPIIGLMMGLLWSALFWAVLFLELPIPVSAALLTAYPFVVSGFIHLDRFMDCNDAILSRRPLEERQRILKDSRVGAFAVITVVLLFMMIFSGMWAIVEEGAFWISWCLMGIPVFSRAMSADSVMGRRPLSTSQYEPSFHPQKNRGFRICNGAIWLLATLLLVIAGAFAASRAGEAGAAVFMKSALVMIGAQFAASLLSGIYARKQLGGMSGDIAGFMLVWSELAAVLALAVI